MCVSLSLSQMKLLPPPVRPEIFPASPKRSDSVKFVEFATQSASAAAAAARRSLRTRNRRLQCAIRDPRFAHHTAELSPLFSFLPDKKTKGWENTFPCTFAICTRPETRRNIRKMCSLNLLIQLSECRKYNRDTSLLILVLTVS